MQEELKPCPFCGGKAYFFVGDVIDCIPKCFIQCKKCSATIGDHPQDFLDRREAITAWNMRSKCRKS